MHPENITLTNPLISHSDLRQLVDEMLEAVTPFLKKDESRIDLANFTAHYGQRVASMETLSRLLWGVTPLLAGKHPPENLLIYVQAIKVGTDPGHADYWGEVGPYDQCIVEMAVYGLLLALAPDVLLTHFSTQEKENLWRWLKQSETVAIPDNNWHFFPILVQVGFRRAGLPFDTAVMEKHFIAMEAYYLGDGWYSDGPGRPRDYYISMAFHFYGLIYAKLMAHDDTPRCVELRRRASRFAADFIHFFADDGAAVPFGRSLTYRFAQAAFWSAAAWAELDVYSPGIMKGIVLRHLRSWMKQPIFDRDGVLSVGYGYPNLIMAEDYNAPGSPYWALKTMLVLALEEKSPFWQAEECPLPDLPHEHLIAHASQILVHQPDHVWMLTSGQLELNNFVNTEAKYCKFAYSARYGFTVERGRHGLKHASVDAMLLLSEKDNYWRGRRDCTDVTTANGMIVCRWQPWHDVEIETWLVPLGDWHIRVHHIRSARELDTAEGGFSTANRPQPQIDNTPGRAVIATASDCSAVFCLSGEMRQGEVILTPPNSNLLFADCAAIPVLRGTLSPGETLLITAVWAGNAADFDANHCPRVKRHNTIIRLMGGGREKALSLNGAREVLI